MVKLLAVASIVSVSCFADTAESKNDAVAALKELRSIANPSISLVIYSARLADTRIRVGRFLDAAEDSPDAAWISAVLGLYDSAMMLWPPVEVSKAQRVIRRVVDEPIARTCPALEAEYRRVDGIMFPRSGKHLDNFEFMVALYPDWARPEPMWDCASAIMAVRLNQKPLHVEH